MVDATAPQHTVDEDGFVCLACPDTYEGFVDEDWTLSQVLSRFAEQMSLGRAFVAYPGPDCCDEPLTVTDALSDKPASRVVSGVMSVGEGGLWLTDYTEMTMAAQFPDSRPIAYYHPRLPVVPGIYKVILRQLEGEDIRFELAIVAAPDAPLVAFDEVPWFDLP